MNRGPVIEYYVGVVRKHWLQILLVGLVVSASGVFYHSRQLPAFQATTKLKIIRQTARSPAGEMNFTFEEDQVFYNTQYNLLTTQLDWAGKVLDRAAYRVLELLGGECPPGLSGAALEAKLGEVWTTADSDGMAAVAPGELAAVREKVVAGAWGLDEDSFLAGVQAAPIPSTYLAELSFSASDPGLAVLFANLYAELYRDVSRDERKESVERQISLLTTRRNEANKELEDLAKEIEVRRNENLELSLPSSTNLPQQEADAIAARMNQLEMEQMLRRAEETKAGAVLKSLGISAIVPEEGPVRMEGPDGADPSAVLGESSEALGLAVVEASESVAQVRSRIRSLEEQVARLRLDLTEENPEVKRGRRKLEEAQGELGREVAAAIGRSLEGARDRERSISDLRVRLEKKRDAARELNKLYAEHLASTEKKEAKQREIDSLEREIQGLKELKDSPSTDKAAGALAIQNIGIERRARMADARQIRPNTMMILLLTGLAALFLSFGSAFLVEWLDDTIKTKEDFARLVSIPDIGFIPRISEKEFERKDLAVAEKPRSGVAEAFRSIRTGILFSMKDQEIRSFLITSAGPGEGKTTVAVNLAATMAEAGRGKVLLVDADLRKPRVHTALGIENTVGLTNCLVGSADLASVVRPTQVENLYVLTAGPAPPNPAELLGGHRMREILAQAQEEYGKVILDTPPLVAVTDSCLLAPLVDGVFLVISVGKTSWRLIARGKESLAAVGAVGTGAILNNIRSPQRGYGYGYGYGYGRYYGGYGETAKKP